MMCFVFKVSFAGGYRNGVLLRELKLYEQNMDVERNQNEMPSTSIVFHLGSVSPKMLPRDLCFLVEFYSSLVQSRAEIAAWLIDPSDLVSRSQWVKSVEARLTHYNYFVHTVLVLLLYNSSVKWHG
jgi:hypothetical protein